MRAPPTARVILTGVSAIRLRPWAHLPHSPGITALLANPRRPIDPSASRTSLAVRWWQATNPDRSRSGRALTRPRSKRSGWQRNQPDFFYGASWVTSGRGKAQTAGAAVIGGL